jgi:hypothetical protein
MGQNNFKKDLAESEKGVNTLIELLKKKGITEVETNDDKEYDVAYRNELNQRVTVEVKEDFVFPYTGNVAVEIMQRGKPTGISSTSADYYVYKLASDFYSVKTDVLKAKLKESVAAKETTKKVFSDSIKEIQLLLVPVAAFTSWCSKIN